MKGRGMVDSNECRDEEKEMTEEMPFIFFDNVNAHRYCLPTLLVYFLHLCNVQNEEKAKNSCVTAMQLTCRKFVYFSFLQVAAVEERVSTMRQTVHSGTPSFCL